MQTTLEDEGVGPQYAESSGSDVAESHDARGHTELVQVHFDDLDLFGMVHNSRYALFVERAVATYWTAKGWNADPTRSAFPGSHLAVREFLVSYRAPILEPGFVSVHFWISRLGNTSVVYEYEIRPPEGDFVYAHGHRTLVSIDPETVKPAPISEEMRAAAQSLIK
ncbi:acyl-CoA thioesterase [Streptomyces sp. NPDC127084]|uniref:acyl-CoA thioesterase n=1 Tax=Streptomyces sp. NPDC127084 TaxID=3347133 RepID=UPI003663FF07